MKIETGNLTKTTKSAKFSNNIIDLSKLQRNTIQKQGKVTNEKSK